MEGVLSLIFHGCNLVKDLEANLPNLANQPSDLLKSCDEIVRVFGDSRERLNALDQVAAYGQMMHHQESGLAHTEIDGAVQEWLRFSQAMDHVVVRHASQQVHHGLPESSRVAGLEAMINARELGGGDDHVAADQPMDVGESGAATLPRSRRRNEADRRTIRVPAPRMGNTEVPPEDGYTWRKYGQKEILGSRFPRGYYRCTHQKLYHCPAKKQVQRLDHDPYMYQVTYRGDHTCTMSSTAPSIPPPPIEQPITTQSPPSSVSIPLGHWLSMDIRPSVEGTTTTTTNFDMQMYRDQFGAGIGGGAGLSSGGTAMSDSGRGSSTISRYIDYQQGAADLADAMFNSGSTSNNSMELIFSSMEDRWEGGDKKN